MKKDEILRYAGQKLMELGNNGDRDRFRRQMQAVINAHSNDMGNKERRILIDLRRIIK